MNFIEKIFVLVFSVWVLLACEKQVPKGSLTSKKQFKPSGEISFVDQNNNSVSFSDFENKVLVINFFFSHCKGPCPTVLRHVFQVSNKFKINEKVKFISITVDPENDTPQHLSVFSQKYSDQHKSWLFLTGLRKNILEIAKQLQLAVGNDYDMNLHPTRIVLIDKSNNIRSYYNGLDPNVVESISHDIQNII